MEENPANPCWILLSPLRVPVGTRSAPAWLHRPLFKWVHFTVAAGRDGWLAREGADWWEMMAGRGDGLVNVQQPALGKDEGVLNPSVRRFLRRQRSPHSGLKPKT